MYANLNALVGQEVTFTPEHGDPHHGIIRTATWNTMGEPVVIVQADEGPARIGSGYVLIGDDASALIATLQNAA